MGYFVTSGLLGIHLEFGNYNISHPHYDLRIHFIESELNVESILIENIKILLKKEKKDNFVIVKK